MAFQINKQMQRASEKGPAKNAESAKNVRKPSPHKPVGQEIGEGMGHVEFHKGPPTDGSMEHAQYHTVHHPSGEMKGHETAHQAHHAMNDHYQEDGCNGDGSGCDHTTDGKAGEESESLGDLGMSDSGAEY